jgi:hypothetical protein
LRVTVQVVVALLPKADGEQDTELTWTGAVAVREKVWDPPFRLAVRVAV